MYRDDDSDLTIYAFFESGNKWNYRYSIALVNSNNEIHIPLNKGKHFILRQSIFKTAWKEFNVPSWSDKVPGYTVYPFDTNLTRLCIQVFYDRSGELEYNEYMASLAFMAFIKNVKTEYLIRVTDDLGRLPSVFSTHANSLKNMFDGKKARSSPNFRSYFPEPFDRFKNELLPLYKMYKGGHLTKTDKAKLLEYHSIVI